MHRLFLGLILCLTLACCSSNYYYYASSSASLLGGPKRIDITKDTPEAVEARQFATAEILENISPDTCSFNQLKNIYQCDDEATATAINTRVADARKKIDIYLLRNGFPSTAQEYEEFGSICLLDLYDCRFVKVTPKREINLAYCNTKISAYVLDVMKEDGTLWQEDTSYQEGYKYRIIEQ